MTKKRKLSRVGKGQRGVVVPFRRSLRPLAARKMSVDVLHMTLVAARARAELDSYFEAPLDREQKVMRAKALSTFVSHFSQRGVRFDADHYPLFPPAPCCDVDLEMLLETAATVSMDFLCELEPLGMYFDHVMDEFVDLGWRHGFLHTKPQDDSDRWLVPVVLTLDMKTMELGPPDQIIDREQTDLHLPLLERLVAVQHPKTWARWTSLRANGART